MGGVILDSEHILQGISRSFTKLPEEDQSHFLSRVSHLHHQNQNIRQIGDLSSVRNLTVLYLYDNRLTKLERLESIPNLQMLYLQNNKISKIENLNHLAKLRKLYLSRNRISVVENLEGLKKLKELHVDHQYLDSHQNLIFDPRTCQGLQSLEILSASGNQMLTLDPLQECRSLCSLNASENQIGTIEEDILSKMTALKDLDLRENPLTKTSRHWELVLGICQSLTSLNGKNVQDNSRIMMKNLKEKRWKRDN